MSTPAPPARRSPAPPLLAAGTALLALLLVVLLVPQLRAGGWRDWVEHRPAEFSELAFSDPEGLPESFAPGSAVTLTAEVTNHRSTARTLEYTVTVTDRATGARRTDSTGRLEVAAGAGAPLAVRVALPEHEPVRVALQLADGPVVEVLMDPRR
ncbi:hypothetical protein [Kineococcus indalonis]|uniref:hypothetical protein n=1 Tax=Kineococcus indalonis TaxID=2696566 RepID=UPI001411ED12|nr:hypothetical protein [Kineococcus indalonis]NAZ85053.1 hypothetical protein [Kineococcus indalonis]